MRQDNTGWVHRRNLSSPQRVLGIEGCSDISHLELVIVEVEHGTARFCHGIKIYVKSRLAEGHHGFWVRARTVKVSRVPTGEAQLVDLTTVILWGMEMMISVKVGCFGGFR